MRVRAITVGLLLGAGTASTMAAGSTLSPDQIKAIFATGTPFAAISRSGRAFSFTFNPDGSAQDVPAGKKAGTTGTWRLSGSGYCTNWGSGEHCYTVERDGDAFDVRDAAGNLISSWTPAAQNSAQPVQSAPTAAKGRFADGTYAGPVTDAYYGLVQIQAIVQGGRLADIRVLRYPSDRSTSVAINRRALPMLRDEVVKAQSVKVDIISGATLTSEAFIQSLGAAMRQATL